MLTLQKNIEFMISDNEKNDQQNLKKTIKSIKSLQNQRSANSISNSDEKPGELSEISAFSSQLKDDKNKEYYEYKSQYLSDDIFFAKLNKKTLCPVNGPYTPLISSNQISLNRENSENNRSNRSFSDKNHSIVDKLDFLKIGSLATTVILLMVSTIGGGAL